MTEAGDIAVGQRARLALRARLEHLPRGRDLRRFLSALRTPERSSALRAIRDGVVVTWTLRRRGVRPLLSVESSTVAELDAARAARVSAAVDTGLAMLPFAATCLRRSLVLLHELRRLGLTATLHVGVRVVAARTEAHAWVQVGGSVVNDDPRSTATYVPLANGAIERLLPLLP